MMPADRMLSLDSLVTCEEKLNFILSLSDNKFRYIFRKGFCGSGVVNINHNHQNFDSIMLLCLHERGPALLHR